LRLPFGERRTHRHDSADVNEGQPPQPPAPAIATTSSRSGSGAGSSSSSSNATPSPTQTIARSLVARAAAAATAAASTAASKSCIKPTLWGQRRRHTAVADDGAGDSAAYPRLRRRHGAEGDVIEVQPRHVGATGNLHPFARARAHTHTRTHTHTHIRLRTLLFFAAGQRNARFGREVRTLNSGGQRNDGNTMRPRTQHQTTSTPVYRAPGPRPRWGLRPRRPTFPRCPGT
jgi:hypothetical protein